MTYSGLFRTLFLAIALSNHIGAQSLILDDYWADRAAHDPTAIELLFKRLETNIQQHERLDEVLHILRYGSTIDSIVRLLRLKETVVDPATRKAIDVTVARIRSNAEELATTPIVRTVKVIVPTAVKSLFRDRVFEDKIEVDIRGRLTPQNIIERLKREKVLPPETRFVILVGAEQRLASYAEVLPDGVDLFLVPVIQGEAGRRVRRNLRAAQDIMLRLARIQSGPEHDELVKQILAWSFVELKSYVTPFTRRMLRANHPNFVTRKNCYAASMALSYWLALSSERALFARQKYEDWFDEVVRAVHKNFQPYRVEDFDYEGNEKIPTFSTDLNILRNIRTTLAYNTLDEKKTAVTGTREEVHQWETIWRAAMSWCQAALRSDECLMSRRQTLSAA